MSALTLRQLEIFIRVVEAGSFRRCAEQCGISQVSVSEHIRALERQLGAPLFVRNRGAAAELTEAGRKAHRHACDALDHIDRMFTAFGHRPAATNRRKLTIGAPGYAVRQLRQGLASFIARHPELDVEMETVGYEVLVERLAANTMDMGYFFGFGPVPEIESALAWKEEIGLYAGPDHPLAQRSVVRGEELAAYPMVTLPEKSQLRIIVDRALDMAGAGGSPVVFQSDDYGLVVEAATRGLGYVCLFERSVAADVARGALCPLRIDTPLPALEIRHAIRRALRSDPLMRELMTSLHP